MTKTTTAPPTGRRRKLVIQLALLTTTLLLLAWRARPDGRLHVIFLETIGDAALIQTPAGGYVLIDGGGDPAALTAALGRHMPFWQRALDMVVLTSPDSKHLPGQVAALARYRAGAALAPPMTKRGATLNEWRRLLDEQGAHLQVARAGDRLDLGGAILRVLAAGDGDESGLLLRLDYGATSVVFDHSGGEADEEALAAIGPPRATLLAFPWQRDPRIAIVETLRPRALVFTDGQEADRPAELMLTTRAIGGAAVYHEQLNGAIEWISDGRSSYIITER
jgi:competence protein ComEC